MALSVLSILRMRLIASSFPNQIPFVRLLRLSCLCAKMTGVRELNIESDENWATPSSLLVKGHLRSKEV